MVEKNCKNCSYYIQHYRKDKIRYETVCCGHCINKTRSGFRKTDKICEHYQEKAKEQEKQEQIMSATAYLSFIAKRLSEIKEVLQEPEPD